MKSRTILLVDERSNLEGALGVTLKGKVRMDYDRKVYFKTPFCKANRKF